MPHRVSRRQVVQSAGSVGLGLLVGCGRWPGQESPPPKVPRIGFFFNAPEAGPGGAFYEAFLQGLREHGYVDGQNIVIERRYSAIPGEWPSLATELVRLPVDVIVAPPTATALAAKHATSTIPIVFVTTGDPVGFGLLIPAWTTKAMIGYTAGHEHHNAPPATGLARRAPAAGLGTPSARLVGQANR